jgi:RNA polymerase sigma-70 factor (ECF subfamily)
VSDMSTPRPRAGRAEPGASTSPTTSDASRGPRWDSGYDVINGRLAQTDAELWWRLRLADEHAFAELFGRHRDAVYTYAFRRTASWSVAEDVTQAVFTNLWRRARGGRIDPLRLDSARPALLAMARDECGNANRTRRRQKALVDRAEAREAGAADSDQIGEWIEAEGTMHEIRRLLDVLPANQREVIEFVAWADLPLAEAAAVLGIGIGTVKSRLSRARARLIAAGGAALLHDSTRRL